MKDYNPKEIEQKWRDFWQDKEIFKTKDGSGKPKFYVLDMFPYPSGEGLHVGHPKGYIATDVVARMKKMQGFEVLHPMGWDAFGLPAENYAIKNKIHPAEAVEKNIKRFRSQMDKVGFTYDWSREIKTTDPEYYKWTQWTFLQMFKKGLVFQSFEPINWCPSCKTGLANEDLEQGKCERCGSEIERKPLRQWVIKITDYAERLLDDLKLLDWENSIIEMQKNWIGRSEGVEIKFHVSSCKFQIEVFTTRLDTIFGCTYVVIAPEHSLIQELKSEIENWPEVENYIAESKKKSDMERTELAKEKTGVELKGIKAINPFNNGEVSVFISDYVVAGYGTGAVMAVPAHDMRDYDFAIKHSLLIKRVIIEEKDGENQKSKIKNQNNNVKLKINAREDVYEEEGTLTESGEFSGLGTAEAREKMADWLEEKGFGKRKVNYKLRDWVFSRQRYWGEPIPLVHCEKCGVVAVPEKDLPLELPKVKNYEPTGTGESPLAGIEEWVNTTCPQCGGKAKRETNTMPQWAGSCWYYLAYIMRGISNFQFPIFKCKKEFDNWLPVDLYVGGAEHATRHLIYARFWHKFLQDIGVVSTAEPFHKLFHVGLIMAEDGRKMSKRWGNVINPDDVIEEYGADSLRLYEMFMGPFSEGIAWNTKGLVGTRRFLEKVWKIGQETRDKEQETNNAHIEKLMHKTIKKVTEDIENFKFNTAVSQLMILVNELEKSPLILNTYYLILLKLLAPFAPHIAEELWSVLGNKESISQEEWPKYDPELIKDEMVSLIIQINGKVRDKVEVGAGKTEEEIKEIVLTQEKTQRWLEGKEIRKIIFIPNKLINIVV